MSSGGWVLLGVVACFALFAVCVWFAARPESDDQHELQAIVVDFRGPRYYVGFKSDEEAAAWAHSHLPDGSWRFEIPTFINVRSDGGFTSSSPADSLEGWDGHVTPSQGGGPLKP